MSGEALKADDLVDDVDRDMIARGDRIGAVLARAFLAHYDEAAARIIAVEAERDAALENAHFATECFKEANARIAVLEAALRPFSEAEENLEDDHADGSPIWETPAAMGIDAKHLRAARAALTPEPS